MKKVGSALTIVVLSITCILISYFASGKQMVIKTKNHPTVVKANKVEEKKNKKEIPKEDKKVNKEKKEEVVVEPEEIVEPVIIPTPVPEPIVYDGLTMAQLSAKLDASLHSTLSGYGSVFANASLSLGLDPYLATAIVLHETGCKWNCSTLLKQCNNVGGMKGSPGCGGGAYKAFPTLEEGIRSYVNNLYYNYYSIGLTTPEAIGPKYAESSSWAGSVNTYIQSIRAS